MGDAMINVYYRLVKSGIRVIEDVPEAYRDAVKDLLDASGDGEDIPENQP